MFRTPMLRLVMLSMSLSSFHAEVGAFSGATILGDGGVALILDTGHLVAAGQRSDAQLRAAS